MQQHSHRRYILWYQEATIRCEEVRVPSALALTLIDDGSNRRQMVQIYRNGYLADA
jgi:hypothetical protein